MTEERNGLPELPKGWVWTTVGEITQPIEKVQPKENPNTQFTYLDISSIDNQLNRVVEPKTYYGSEAPSRARQLIRVNDVLFSTVRTYLKNIALVPCIHDGQIASTGFSVLRGESGISSKYLFYYSLTDPFLNALSKLQRGTSYPAVRDSDVRAQSIPLPPLPEQHRIVAKVEELFTQLDAGVVALEKAKAQLRRYRQAVLKAAVEGELTREWREAYRGELEPSSVLLERILEERRARWEAEHPGKRYEPPIPPDMEDLPKLPEVWCWARAEQICDFITKGTTPKAHKLFYGSGEVPFIKVYNMTFDGRLDFSVNPTFVSRKTHAGELARSLVLPGDVLMNIVGPPLGKVSIVPDTYPEWNMNQAIARFRPMSSFDRRFLSYCLRSESVLSWAIRRRKATAGQSNLTLEICRDLPIPIPPMAEQHCIVEEVEQRLSVIDEMEKAVEQSLKRAERLRQSILKRAFEGKLVPQDPSDEPASVLLERIKAEKARREGNDSKGSRKKEQPNQMELF